MKTATTYSLEVRERAVRMVREHQGEHESEWAAMASMAGKIERDAFLMEQIQRVWDENFHSIFEFFVLDNAMIFVE